MKIEYNKCIEEKKTDLPYTLWLEKKIFKLEKPAKEKIVVSYLSESTMEYLDKFEDFKLENPNKKLEFEDWLVNKITALKEDNEKLQKEILAIRRKIKM